MIDDIARSAAIRRVKLIRGTVDIRFVEFTYAVCIFYYDVVYFGANVRNYSLRFVMGL